MSVGFLILTVLFIVVSAIMILIILVQRPQGGGLAGAFGGAGGGSTDTVFGGRVGDALTAMTVFAFAAYLLLAVGLNIMDPSPKPEPVVTPAASTQPITDSGAAPSDAAGTGTTMPTIDPNLPAVPAGEAAPVPPVATPETPPATSPSEAPAGGGA